MGKRVVFELTDENAELIDKIRKQNGITISHVFNSVVELLYKIQDDVNNELADFCESKVKKIDDDMIGVGEYERGSLINKCYSYQKLATFFKCRQIYDIDFFENGRSMQKINMLNSCLVCPSDYIILNRDDAKRSYYASVVEVSNALFGVPHFIYFNSKSVKSYKDSDYKIIEKLCAKQYPNFQEIIDSIENPVKGKKSPIIKHFPVYIQGDPHYPQNYIPPMGIKIIKKSVEKENQKA